MIELKLFRVDQRPDDVFITAANVGFVALEITCSNFQFFGAPVGLFFCIDRGLGPPQWADLGMYMQSVMLLAREHGLHTCAQEAWSIWHRTVGEFLDLPPELMLFSGMALGYRDETAPINRLRTAREPLGAVAQLRGF